MKPFSRIKRLFAALIVMCFSSSVLFAQDLSEQVEVRRTEYGVPHIKAENLEAAAFAMGYLQVEDYGTWIVNPLVRGRGEWAKYHTLTGSALEKRIDLDAASKLKYQIAVETFDKLDQDTKDLLKGYAEGINRYIENHPKEFAKWIKPDFNAIDIHARSIGGHSSASLKKFLNAQKKRESRTAYQEMRAQGNVWATLAADAKELHPDVGSNVWALAPSRTTTGNAVLVRNPHLSWTGGYYEAHLEVAGHFNFYGDFRRGQPLGIVGGFNEHLGWSTTNNYTDNDEVYAFTLDPENPENYILDGTSHAIIKKEVEVEYKKGSSIAVANRSFDYTPYGPVVHKTKTHIYVMRSAQEGEYRTNTQFLKMMSATTLEEWKDAMRMQARSTSNFTYADKEGNIFYVWNGSIPKITHASGLDTGAVYVDKSSSVWTELISWDELPQLLNPKGGYLHNENDPFHYTNLNAVFDENKYPSNFPKARLRLRSQLSLQLIGNENEKLSLEEIIARKHDMTSLLAVRVKEDLITALKASKPKGQVKKALQQMEEWDNTVAKESKGGVLFSVWWKQYSKLAGKNVFVQTWSKDAPTTTPYGLANPEAAVEAFEWAIEDCNIRYGGWDQAWGDVHRAVLGDQDLPVGGATGVLGCFRVVWYVPHKQDGKKLQVRGGDGWILAVEFAETPIAHSVLPYGNSNKKSSPYFANQLELFTNNELKPVAYTEADIQEKTIKTYDLGRSK